MSLPEELVHPSASVEKTSLEVGANLSSTVGSTSGEGSVGLNPNAAPFQFTSAISSEIPVIQQPSFTSYAPYSGDDYHAVHNDIVLMPSGAYLGASQQFPIASQHYPGAAAAANSTTSATNDELLVLKRMPYRAKVLPPPLPFESHKKIWLQNTLKQEFEYRELSASNESDDERKQRLQAYKQIMDRWHQHIIILDEKREWLNGSFKVPCKSYMEAASECSTGDTDIDEETLKVWSEECVKWWQEGCKKRVRKPKKKRSDEPFDVTKTVGGLGELDLSTHPSVLAADLVGTHQSFLFPSTDLQFDDHHDVDDDDASDIIASELLLQFED